MSSTRPQLITSLASSKNLKTHQTSSQTYLKNGLVTRAFNAFPRLVTEEQIGKLKKIILGIEKLNVDEKGRASLCELSDKTSTCKLIEEVALSGASQMLDEFGLIQWSLIELLEWENYEACYQPTGIKHLLYSYVHTVLQQASQFLASFIGTKTLEYSAFGLHFNSVAMICIDTILKTTRQKEVPSSSYLMQNLIMDYQQSIMRLERNSSLITKFLFTDKAHETKVEKNILQKYFLNKNKLELSDLLLQIRLDCEDKGVGYGLLARVVKHYTNRFYYLKTDVYSTTHIKKLFRHSETLSPTEGDSTLTKARVIESKLEVFKTVATVVDEPPKREHPKEEPPKTEHPKEEPPKTEHPKEEPPKTVTSKEFPQTEEIKESISSTEIDLDLEDYDFIQPEEAAIEFLEPKMNTMAHWMPFFMTLNWQGFAGCSQAVSLTREAPEKEPERMGLRS